MGKSKLSEYSSKRTFSATPEPAAAVPEGRSGPLLFVIQQHSATRLHYDLRLECDGVLKSWAVPKGPSLDPTDKRLAVPTEDHPFDYASFEGIIPAGQYGAGEVIVWDCGVYSPDEREAWVSDRSAAEAQVLEGIRKGKLGITLRGEKVKGSFALVKTSRGKDWLLIKHQDRFVTKDDITARNRSVLSGIALDEMKAMPVQRIDAAALAPAGRPEAMPQKFEPMHAELADAPFNKPDWMWEPKLDGYRVLAFVGGGKVRLSSRRGLELATTFPGLAQELAGQGASLLLDGEIVAFDESGKPSFNALQNRFQLKSERDIAAAEKTTPVVLYAFDLLHFEGVDLRRSPYADRRRYLAQCLLPSPRVQLVHASEDGVGLYSAALASGFEGVVGKRKAGRYESGKRSASWIKVKATRSAEFVVGGYTKGKGAREALGSLLLGYWSGSKLHFAGHVGSGLDDRVIADLSKRFPKLERRAPPFVEKPPLQRPTTWIDPELVVEVTFAEWTPDGMLRAPVFQRVRDDIESRTIKGGPKAKRAKPARLATPPNEVAEVLQQLENKSNRIDLAVGGAKIRLTNLDRVYWPADPETKQPPVTKRDLVR